MELLLHILLVLLSACVLGYSLILYQVVRMPAANPLRHIAPGNRSYVNEQADSSVAAQGIKSAHMMPGTLALVLVGSAAGLYGLKALGFRFVVEVGKAGK